MLYILFIIQFYFLVLKFFYTEVVFAILSCIASFIYICPHDKSQIDINDRIMSLFALSTLSFFLSPPLSLFLFLPPSLPSSLPFLFPSCALVRSFSPSLLLPSLSIFIHSFIYLPICQSYSFYLCFTWSSLKVLFLFTDKRHLSATSLHGNKSPCWSGQNILAVSAR